MSESDRRQFLRGLRITTLGTLSSRVLGMLRDVSTAALLGMSGSGAMDAFVVAFRLPNLFRRLFGEGALAASFLPVLSATLEDDRRRAWQLVSVLITWLALFLAALTLSAELVCGLLWWLSVDRPRVTLVAGLSAVMLPYLWFICLAAQVAAALHALGRFAAPALAPVLLNLCWLVAAAAGWWWQVGSPEARAFCLAGAVLVAGVLQLACQWPVLWAAGFRFDYRPENVREPIARVLKAMAPMIVGLAATQISTFFDSLLAWGLTSTPPFRTHLDLPGYPIPYPLAPGATSAIYFGERLYEFPQGLMGMAVATVIFPLLSRHAARGHWDKLGHDLTLGLRLVVFVALPASVGLMLLAEPITRCLFEHGAFTAHDAARTARVIAVYGGGVLAYCALPVIVRGFYSLGDQRTPLEVSVGAIFFDLVANLILVWPLAEVGLALSTSLSAWLQAILLVALFARRFRIEWGTLARTLLGTGVASLPMGVACYAVLEQIGPPSAGMVDDTMSVGLPLAAGSAAFLLSAWALRLPELFWLLAPNRLAQTEA